MSLTCHFKPSTQQHAGRCTFNLFSINVPHIRIDPTYSQHFRHYTWIMSIVIVHLFVYFYLCLLLIMIYFWIFTMLSRLCDMNMPSYNTFTLKFYKFIRVMTIKILALNFFNVCIHNIHIFHPPSRWCLLNIPTYRLTCAIPTCDPMAIIYSTSAI